MIYRPRIEIERISMWMTLKHRVGVNWSSLWFVTLNWIPRQGFYQSSWLGRRQRGIEIGLQNRSCPESYERFQTRRPRPFGAHPWSPGEHPRCLESVHSNFVSRLV